MGTDHAEAAGHGSLAAAKVDLTGDVVKVEPLAVGCVHDALGTQHGAEAGLIVELAEGIAQLFLGELLRGLHAPALEDLVGMVMVMMVMLVFVIVIVMMMVMALALGIVALLAVLMVVMVMMVLVLVIVIIVVMVMVVLVLIVVIVMMVMMALAFGIVALVLVVVVMVMMVLVLHLFQLMLETILVHGLTDLLAAELGPRGGDETGLGIEGLQDFSCLEGLFGLCGIGAAHDDEVGIGNLVVEKLAEVAGVHLGLAAR